MRLLRLSFGFLLLAVLALSSVTAKGQVVASVAGGVDVHSTEPGLNSTGFYSELSLRVPLGRLVSIELAAGRHTRELDLAAHGYTLSDHLSLRQYPIMLGALLTPALSSSTRLLIPVGAFVAPTNFVESYRTYYDSSPASYEQAGTDYGVFLGLGFEVTVGRHASVHMLTRYVKNQWPSGNLSSRSPDYVTVIIGAGYRF